MRPLKEVIDEASKLCGGQNALARRLGVSNGYMSQVTNGGKKISPEKAALLAEVVQSEDGRDLAALAMIEQAKPEEAERLRRVFFRLRAIGGAATVIFFAAVLLGGHSTSYSKPSDLVSAGKQKTHSGMLVAPRPTESGFSLGVAGAPHGDLSRSRPRTKEASRTVTIAPRISLLLSGRPCRLFHRPSSPHQDVNDEEQCAPE